IVAGIGGVSESDTVRLCLDPNIHSGWPQEIGPLETCYLFYPLNIIPFTDQTSLGILTSYNNSLDETKILLFRHDGTIAKGWPKVLPLLTSSNTNPATGDLDGTGEYRIVTTGSRESKGDIYILDLMGTLREEYRTDSGAFSGIALGDLDGNKENLEMVYQSYCSIEGRFPNFDFIPGSWPVPIGSSNTYSRPPAIGDLDGDSYNEIIHLADLYSKDSALITSLHVLKGDGEPKEGFEKLIEIKICPYWINPQPVLGDIDGNGTLEILIATGYDLKIWRDNGELFPLEFPIKGNPDMEHPEESNFLSSPILGDISGNGIPEIIVPLFSWATGDACIYVVSWNRDKSKWETLPNWPQRVPWVGNLWDA
ncbi:MAG: hypothetical protein AAB267_09745, partial [Candidatus Desantisbacteria bacterium]